ncbi:MAG: lysophospholipid acyltransferase family protein, partial [Armatimonadota bacterium]|nr:lysophospholipid acyltransferase family protein [Armatimonadota bacterium]
FPEGHRSDDSRLQPGQDGAGLIALRSRAPILPVGMAGTQRMLPPGSTRFHRARATVRFGKPFTLDDLYDQPGRDAVREATRRIMAAIEELLPEEHRRAPAEGA